MINYNTTFLWNRRIRFLLFIYYLPAKSTIFNLPTLICASSSCSDFEAVSTVTVKIACDREEAEFMLVFPVIRKPFPRCSNVSISPVEFTVTFVKPVSKNQNRRTH